MELHRTYMEVFKLLVWSWMKFLKVGFWANYLANQTIMKGDAGAKAHAEFLLLQNYLRTIVSLLEVFRERGSSFD